MTEKTKWLVMGLIVAAAIIACAVISIVYRQAGGKVRTDTTGMTIFLPEGTRQIVPADFDNNGFIDILCLTSEQTTPVAKILFNVTMPVEELIPSTRERR